MLDIIFHSYQDIKVFYKKHLIFMFQMLPLRSSDSFFIELKNKYTLMFQMEAYR